MAPSMDHAAPFSVDDPDSRPSKRRRIVHHQTHHKQKLDSNENLPESKVQDLLMRSIGIAMEALGYDAVEPLALEHFRAMVEQCKSHPTIFSEYLTNYI